MTEPEDKFEIPAERPKPEPDHDCDQGGECGWSKFQRGE